MMAGASEAERPVCISAATVAVALGGAVGRNRSSQRNQVSVRQQLPTLCAKMMVVVLRQAEKKEPGFSLVCRTWDRKQSSQRQTRQPQAVDRNWCMRM
jgi:RNase P protein component